MQPRLGVTVLLGLAFFAAVAALAGASVPQRSAIGQTSLGPGIAFTRAAKWGSWIGVTDLAGNALREISPRPAMLTARDDYNPVWSPDGSGLAFMRMGYQSGLYVVDGGGKPRRVLRLPANAGWEADFASWSLDGRRLAYADGPLYVTNRDGTNTRRLTAGSTCSPVWSPDGRSLLYLAAVVAYASDGKGCWLGEGMADTPGYGSLERIEADGTGRRLLARGSFSDAVWSPDGNLVAYTNRCTAIHTYPEEQWSCSVSLMRPDGAGKRLLVQPDVAGWVEWISGGREVLWFSWGNLGIRPMGLYATDVSTGQTRSVLAGDAGAYEPVGVSGDGQTIAVRTGSPTTVLVVTPDGQELQRVTKPSSWDCTRSSVYLP